MVKVAEIKQENIILAAIDIFTEKGLEQASMEAISKKAEVSKRTLYKYYPTKESLFNAIIERMLSNVAGITQTPFNPDEPVKVQLTAIARKEVELLCCPHFISLARMVLSECMRSTDSASLMMKKVQQLEGFKGLSKWIEAGVSAEVLDIRYPDIASEQFMAALKSIVFWPQILVHLPPASQHEREIAIEMAVAQFLSAYLKDS
ncbi:TetR/AcrR family transcriptional regulator [Photobacterium alginatilyticum]|uniref:TetR/AcrR family transcriptional regulator n=1 Tax=Photobacterium alginatilyticum TaxID=1775171 RepID=A0ABW9YP88_9GAMM|nr:TetR/AcrR family transcriptional regulator [Photobacterium alginatilyticum]NBI55687.1 TetR/AcrR family transcriptional regulator [Photobacterium alginatilyticum]